MSSQVRTFFQTTFVARARFITEQSNPKMHKKNTVIATLRADPEQVEIRSRGGGRGGGELCSSHAGDQKRCHWEKSSRLVSFCFFGSRRPDALWMFVFFGLLSRARRFRPNIRDMHRVQDAETKGQKVRFTTKIYQALRDSVVLEKKEIAGNTRADPEQV